MSGNMGRATASIQSTLIAATAKTFDLQLATLNLKHFPMLGASLHCIADIRLL